MDGDKTHGDRVGMIMTGAGKERKSCHHAALYYTCYEVLIKNLSLRNIDMVLLIYMPLLFSAHVSGSR